MTSVDSDTGINTEKPVLARWKASKLAVCVRKAIRAVVHAVTTTIEAVNGKESSSRPEPEILSFQDFVKGWYASLTQVPKGRRHFISAQSFLWETANGTLTAKERFELQVIVNHFNTRLYVMGSRAEGKGRNIDYVFYPVGKGPRTRSDIDVLIDGQLDIDTGGALSEKVSDVGNDAGEPKPWHREEWIKPPYIIFKREPR